MRFATVALSLLALGIASASAQANDNAAAAGLSARDDTIVSRDFARKVAVRSPKAHKKSSRQQSLITNGMLTWYGGGQLSAPACGGKTPSRNDRVVAVKEGGPYKCGDKLHLHYKGKMVEASVVDYCGSCAENHVDLTQGTFQALASLDEGELHGAHIRHIPQ